MHNITTERFTENDLNASVIANPEKWFLQNSKTRLSCPHIKLYTVGSNISFTSQK